MRLLIGIIRYLGLTREPADYMSPGWQQRRGL